MTWFLSYRGTKKSLADWHIFDLQRRTINRGMDTLRFRMPSHAPAFVCDEMIELFQDDLRIFYGKITQAPCHYTPHTESKTYIVSGPYWFLEHLVFQQSWHYFCDNENNKTTSIQRSLCILGQSESGDKQNARQCIEAIIQYAQKHSAPIECGNINGFDFFFPYENIRDCSCAEALKKLLQWTPDAVVYFDYTTQQPTIHFSRASLLSTTPLSLEQCSQFSIVPRNDLKMSAVVIKYEHTHANEKGSWKTVTVDAFPEKATGNEINALVLTVELEGTKTHSQEQWVVTEPIQTDSVAWWQKHLPALNTIPSSSITLSNIRRSHDYPNELVEGAIAPWMQCQAAYETITATISYQTEQLNVHQQTISVKLCSTDATTQTYRKTFFLSTGTEPPQNLAQTLYQSAQCLQYEGQLTFAQNEKDIFPIHHCLLWYDTSKQTQVALPIQEKTHYFDTGNASIKFGAPKQLGPNDLIQLMYANRTRNITEDTNIRFAQKAKRNKTYFPHVTPLLSASEGYGTFSKMIITDQDKKICLDTSTLPVKTQIAPKAFDVVENGNLKKLWLLSS